MAQLQYWFEVDIELDDTIDQATFVDQALTALREVPGVVRADASEIEVS